MWHWGFGPVFNSFKDVTSVNKTLRRHVEPLITGELRIVRGERIISADRKISADSLTFPYGLLQ